MGFPLDPALYGLCKYLSNQMLHLGIDVGTQGTKCIVLDAESNRIVGRGASSYGILPSTIEGRAEQQPSTWIKVITCTGMGERSTVWCRNVGLQHQRPLQRLPLSGLPHTM